MRILCLYNNDCAIPLFAWLEEQGHECVLVSDELNVEWLQDQGFDLAFSYTYSKIIKKAVIDSLHGNVVNLHTSFLPFNRGVDPNMWSIIEETPRGVTLHYIDEQVDRGAIIYQELVPIDNINKETLRTTYDRLDTVAQDAFKKAFSYYDYWPEMSKYTEGKGSYHTDKQGEILREYITSFDMEVEAFLSIMERRQKP